MVIGSAMLLAIPLFGPNSATSAMARQETVRVALFKGVDNVRLDGLGMLLLDERGEPIRVSLPVSVQHGRHGVMVNGRPVKTLLATAPASILVNGKGYRGVVEVTTADKGLVVVNEVQLEDYLVGLINCEISSQWPIEVVKAQAVIARSYALFQKASRRGAVYHLESSVLDQVYEGCDIEDSRAARGVKETAGEVLTFRGNLVQAFYHASCGGHTEAAENVWGMPFSYLQGVECTYCLAAPKVKWDVTLPLKKIETQLKGTPFQVTGLREVQAGERNRSGRVNEVALVTGKGRSTMPATKFRQAIGFNIIRSTNFEVNTSRDEAVFRGVGSGHGVGLCQWGAKLRADEGFDYREILSYYYPGTRVERNTGRP